MLHKISAGRREVGDNSFLLEFRARMLSSSPRMLFLRRSMLQSMIPRVSSNGSPAAHGVLVFPGEKTFGFLI